MKIWNTIPIIDCGDKLIEIPSHFKFIDPHPYFQLGAPYENKNTIWKLRGEVVKRLIKVNDYLSSKKKNFNLLIYDSWRPLVVQEYMFKRAINIECKKLDINVSLEDINSYPSIIEKVEKFWAYPSFDEKCPPPHSTGGALDVCLSDKFGNIIDMGGDIDQMDETSKPDFYETSDNEEAIVWNKRRNLLKEIMNKFEFVQHPDQLWAWKNKKENALYGKI